MDNKEWGPSHHVTHCSLLLRLLHGTFKLQSSVTMDKKKQRGQLEGLMTISETPLQMTIILQLMFKAGIFLI
jgi:hypothetical protein